MATNKIRLNDLFRFYKGLPHQMAAITELEPVSYTHLTLPTKRIV